MSGLYFKYDESKLDQDINRNAKCYDLQGVSIKPNIHNTKNEQLSNCCIFLQRPRSHVDLKFVKLKL